MINLIKHGKTIKEYEDLKEFSLLMRKCMKYLRKFNITVNKLAYKYSKTSWINMLFQDNILDLLYYTEDFYLFFEMVFRPFSLTQTCFMFVVTPSIYLSQ